LIPRAEIERIARDGMPATQVGAHSV